MQRIITTAYNTDNKGKLFATVFAFAPIFKIALEWGQTGTPVTRCARTGQAHHCPQ